MNNSAQPIIIVEDDLEDREIMQDIMTDLGVRNKIIFFAEGAAVLNYLRTTKEQPLAIITDINMPGMDGLTLREEICKDDYLRKKSVPFIYLSTSDGTGILQRVYELQVQGYFVKQNTFEGIKAQVQLILQYWYECKHPNRMR